MDKIRVHPYHNIDINLISNSNIKYVATNGDDSVANGSVGNPYATIKEAINYITDASVDNLYLITIMPGKYEENNPIQMKEYVNIIGLNNSSIIGKNSTQDIFTGIKNSNIQNVEICDALTASGISINTTGSSSYKDITFTDCREGIKIDHIDAEISVLNIIFNTSGSNNFDNGVLIESGNVDINNIDVKESSKLTNIVRCIGINSKLNLTDITTKSPNVTNVFNLDDGSITYTLTGIIENCNNFVNIGDTGTATTIYARSGYLDCTDYYVYNISTTAIINLIGGNLERSKLFTYCPAYGLGWDETSEKFRSIGDFAVGISGLGNSLHVGEGGSYKHGVRCLTYDGSDYVEITNSDDISFPNNNVNTAIYFGDDNSYKFYGISYLMGSTKIDLGTGSIIWEYYDETNGWQEFNILNTLTGYSNSYNGISFGGDDTNIYTIRFDQNIKTGVTESNATNTGIVAYDVNSITGIWIRCRITGVITTSPVFKTPRIKPNYMSIRINGTQSYHGESRSLKNIMLPFGDSGSGGASKTMNISPNISYPFWNNSLNDAATNELYFRFTITEDVDTSSGLIMKYLCSTPYTGITDKLAKITVYSSKIKSGDEFDGTNTEVSQVCDFTYTANDAADLSHFNTVCDRIDISDMVEDDIVFIMIKREGAHADDTLTNSLDFSNVWTEYRTWQKGKNLKP